MDYPEERKQYIDGIACQYLCHIEKAEKPGNVFFAHFHYYIEMLYALSGHFRIYLNGIYHEFAAGDFVLINSREVHQIDALSSKGGSYIVVRFLPELIYDGMTQSHFELKYLLPFITENSIYEKFKRTPLFMPFPEKLRHIPESSMNITQMLRSQTAVMG